MIPADEYRRIAIVGFFTSAALSTVAGTGLLFGLLSPVWLVGGVPGFMIVAFGGYITYREFLLTRQHRRREAERNPSPSARAT